MRLYIKKDRLAFGPFEESEIRRKLATGNLAPDVLVSEDCVNWKPLYELDSVAPEEDPFTPPQNAEPELAIPIPVNDAANARNAAVVKEWYISPDGQQGYGKFSIQELVDLIASEKATLDAQVWREGEEPRAIKDHLAFRPYLARFMKRATTSTAAASAPRSQAGANASSADASEWYVKTGVGATFGPYAAKKVLEMREKGRLTDDALVWRNKELPVRLGDAWTTLQDIAHPLAEQYRPEYRDLRQDAIAEISEEEVGRLNRKLKTTQFWSQVLTAFATLSYLALAIFTTYYFYHACGGDAKLFGEAFGGVFGVVLVLVWFIAFIADAVGYCFGLAFVHAFWSSIPEADRTVAPGRAMRYLVIPFLRMYWAFLVLRGGAVAVNKALFERANGRIDLRLRTVNEFYPTASCALGAALRVTLLPFSFFMFGLPDGFTASMRDAAIQLNELRLEKN